MLQSFLSESLFLDLLLSNHMVPIIVYLLGDAFFELNLVRVRARVIR